MGVAVGGPTDIYQWTFDITMLNGTLFTGTDQSSVKGRFVDTYSNKVGALVSENVTLVTPDPETEHRVLMLAGLGLVGVIARSRLSRA